MPIEQLDLDDHIRLTVSGQVTNSNLDSALAAMIAQPAFVQGTPVLLIDEAGAYKGTATETRAAAASLERLQAAGLGRVAVVVARTLQFGIGRELEAHSETRLVRFRVFRSEKAALRWLSDPLPELY